MKTDTFTKILLTVIAINLTVLTVNNLEIVPKAYASEPPSPFTPDPGINYGLVPLNEDGSINVRLNSSDKIDVNIVGVSTNEQLNVNVEEIGGGYVPNGGPVTVRVQDY